MMEVRAIKLTAESGFRGQRRRGASYESLSLETLRQTQPLFRDFPVSAVLETRLLHMIVAARLIARIGTDTSQVSAW